MVGVFLLYWFYLIVEMLCEFGFESVWVVYGSGFDEIMIIGMIDVVVLEDGKI